MTRETADDVVHSNTDNFQVRRPDYETKTVPLDQGLIKYLTSIPQHASSISFDQADSIIDLAAAFKDSINHFHQ